MAERNRLFALAIGATRLNRSFEQDCPDGEDTFVFRRLRAAPPPTSTHDGAQLPAPGPVDFRIGVIVTVAVSERKARREALRVARRIFPEAEGWIGHHAYATEIAELKTYRQGFG
jgi:hypothetical protein